MSRIHVVQVPCMEETCCMQCCSLGGTLGIVQDSVAGVTVHLDWDHQDPEFPWDPLRHCAYSSQQWAICAFQERGWQLYCSLALSQLHVIQCFPLFREAELAETTVLGQETHNVTTTLINSWLASSERQYVQTDDVPPPSHSSGIDAWSLSGWLDAWSLSGCSDLLEATCLRQLRKYLVNVAWAGGVLTWCGGTGSNLRKGNRQGLLSWIQFSSMFLVSWETWPDPSPLKPREVRCWRMTLITGHGIINLRSKSAPIARSLALNSCPVCLSMSWGNS